MGRRWWLALVVALLSCGESGASRRPAAAQDRVPRLDSAVQGDTVMARDTL